MDLDHPLHPYEPIEHEVTIQKHAIRRYCHPVSFSREDAADVAKMLGVSPAMLLAARRRGQFEECFYKGLGGKRGKPVPLLSPRGQLLDPSHREFARPHPIWGPMWEFLSHAIPTDFEQIVIRRPWFLRDSRSDDPQLRGYWWLCPACKKTCRTIYYPLPVRSIFDSFYADPTFTDPVIQLKLTDADLPHIPPPTFACHRCHQINPASPIEPRFWNHVISYLTAGLLFGHEVPTPASFIPHRQRTRIRQLNRSSPIMRKVLTRFTNDWSYFQIAENLGLTYNAVRHHIRRACAQENVKNPRALAQKLGFKSSLPQSRYEIASARRSHITTLLLANLSNSQIAHDLNIPLYTAARDIVAIYSSHGLKGLNRNSRSALAKLLAVELPPTKHDLLQQKIASLRDQGLTPIQIRHHLNLPRGTVDYYVQKIKRATQQALTNSQSAPEEPIPSPRSTTASMQTPK